MVGNKEGKPEILDYSEFIQYNENHLQIKDYHKKISVLPDDFFESFLTISSLEINAGALTKIPLSIIKLVNLKNITFSGGKYRTLPDLSGLHLLERISIERNNLINLDKEIEKLQQLPNLQKLHIGSYKGKQFPKTVSSLKNLKSLSLGWGLEKKKDMEGLIHTIIEMPWLEKLKIDFYLKPEDIKPNIVKLDFLDEMFLRGYFPENKIPSCIGLTKHVSFNENNILNKVLVSFREKYREIELPVRARQLLFCFHVKNFLELKNLLTDKLELAIKSNKKTGVVLLTKIKSLTKKKLNELLVDTSLYPAKEGDKGNLIYVIGSDTEYDVFADLILKNRDVVFQDHLQDLIVKLEDPWLLQEDNTGLNDQLMKLLASNQPANYKVAFEIIEGGGANKIVQSLLAAIMTSHPDKKIAKKAEQLYEKYGSPLFKQHAKKGVKASLRKSGNTQHKLRNLLKHPEIDEFIFRFMHHTIATSNPNIKDVPPNVFEIKNNPIEIIPEEIIYFGNINKINFYACPNLNLKLAFSHFKKMTGLKHLVLNGSHLTIPSSVGELTQLEVFEAEQNEFEDVTELEKLKNLKILNIAGCKVTTFHWLSSLNNLSSLNLSNNKLAQLPSELMQLTLLTELYIKQNKLVEMDKGLLNLPNLKYLDYSNNFIKKIDYHFFSKNLESLLLRTNKITSFNKKEIENIGIKEISLKTLNLANNLLDSFNIENVNFSNLMHLDISNNKIKALHPSVFINTRLNEFYAGKNQISDIPDSVTTRSHFSKFWIQHNQIKELKESFSRIHIDNADLSNNQIEKLHPDFSIRRERDYSRLYWKMRNNPISKELNGAAGLYGR